MTSTMISCVVLLLATTALTVQTSLPDENCADKTVADVYFLADGSNSINSIGWGRELAFICNFTKSFHIGLLNVQWAFGTFSTEFVHKCNLNKYTKQDDLCKEVLSTTQLKGVTYTFDAIRAIREEDYLNSTLKGARPGVYKVLIVVTDGNSDNITRTIAEADALRKEGVRIIVVSVGKVNQVECIGIAGTDKNVFNVKNFGELDAIKDQMTQRVCKDPVPEPVVCTGIAAVDIVFAIDSSGSIGHEDYVKNFEFVIRSILGFDLGPNAARVAVCTFGTSTKVIFPLTDDKNFIYQKLMNVSYQGSTTNTHLVLYKAQELLSVENGGRPNCKKVVIVVSDGLSTVPEETRKAAQALKSARILIITLRVGPDANKEELEAVASEPEYCFPVSSYSNLVSFANPVTVIACNKS